MQQHTVRFGSHRPEYTRTRVASSRRLCCSYVYIQGKQKGSSPSCYSHTGYLFGCSFWCHHSSHQIVFYCWLISCPFSPCYSIKAFCSSALYHEQHNCYFVLSGSFPVRQSINEAAGVLVWSKRWDNKTWPSSIKVTETRGRLCLVLVCSPDRKSTKEWEGEGECHVISSTLLLYL